MVRTISGGNNHQIGSGKLIPVAAIPPRMEYAGGMAKLIAIHDESGEEILVNADRIATVHNVSVVPSG
jgi:hypothetical protein